MRVIEPAAAWLRGPLTLVIFLSTLLVAASGLAEAQDESDDTVALDPRAVAVIPFTNISGDPADAWIGVGIAETVTADLAQLGSVSIVGREAMLEQGQRQGAELETGDGTVAREIGRGLGVSWIVGGAFQRLGDQIRITARIVEVETGAVGETIKVDGAVDAIFALQDRIVAELSQGVELFGATTTRAARADATRSPSVPGNEGGTRAAAVPGNGSGRGNGNGTGRGGGGRPRPAPSGLSSGLVPEEVTGAITLEPANAPPSRGVADDVGILTGRPTIRPTRVADGPDVDGRLDDAVWRTAVRITDFTQSAPIDGAPPTEETEVWIAYDNANVYFAVHAHYEDVGVMRANRVDRDRAFRDDLITVYFDTFLDQQRAYAFDVNPYGVQGDQLISAGGGGRGGGGRGGPGGGGRFSRGGGGAPRGDRSWDTLFETGAQIVQDGFTAELAIPFKSLRYPQRGEDVPHRWGFQIVREIRGKDDETIVWSPVSRDVAGFLPQMGVLDGMSNLSTSRNMEILPTFTAVNFGSLDTEPSSETFGDVIARDGTEPEGGVNFKYGITSNLTADLAFNPDFSQIESDRPQIEVNQRFALFFPELRPFFLEGAEIFSIRAPVTLVHTRTIVDPLYGAKVTGKVGDTTVGVLYANDEIPGQVGDPTDPAFGKSSQTFVGRARYDLYSESSIGVLATNRSFLNSSSRLVGVDGDFRVGSTHSMAFRVMGTQNEDLDGLGTDGHMYDVNIRKNGRNLSYFVAGYELSPEFETDVGFVRRNDIRRIQGRVSYNWWPQHWLISWGPSMNLGRNWNFDDVLEDTNTEVGVNLNFARNLSFNSNIQQDMERFGGIDFDKRGYRVGGNINTSRKISFGGGFRWGDEIFFDSANPFLGRSASLFSFISVRPVSQLSSQININTSRFTDPFGSFIPELNRGERGQDGEIFDVKIVRALSTFQFTDRLVFRNITEYNTFDRTLGLNFLATYRVNAGTVFYIGYDDHYQQADRLFDGDRNGDGIPDPGYDPRRFEQTNRAFFMKFQYLFRY